MSTCCSLMYPACNAHAPYCHLWTGRLYNIFPYYLINGTILENVDHKACVVIFSTAAFLKLWSADHKWSSGSALVVLLD